MKEAFIPIPTKPLTNMREHWAVRHRRAKAERNAAGMMAPKARVPCTVRMTRVSPRLLDDDNLAGALKSIRDGIADKLGVDDRDPRVTWEYGQEKGKPPGVRVQILVDNEDRGAHNEYR